MPPICRVQLCSNHGGHKFPKDQKVKEEWIKVIRRATGKFGKWTRKEYMVVCGDHFVPEDYHGHYTYHGK